MYVAHNGYTKHAVEMTNPVLRRNDAFLVFKNNIFFERHVIASIIYVFIIFTVD